MSIHCRAAISGSRAIRAALIVTAHTCLSFAASDAAGDEMLARVVDDEITASELESFALVARSTLPAALTTAQADSALLRSLIDKTVLLLEAESLRIDSEPWFGRALNAKVNGQVVKLYGSRAVNSQISIADEGEMVRQRFVDSHRDRALRLAIILVETREEADEVVRQLEHGADFARLATELSLYSPEQGGDMGKYQFVDDAAQWLRPVFALSVGEISQPILFGHRGHSRYAVVTVVDENPVQLESVREIIREELFGQEMERMHRVVLDSLKRVYSPEIQQDNIEAVAERYAQEGGGGADLAPTVLCTYKGGTITFGDLLASFSREGSIDVLADAEWITDTLTESTIPARLYLAAATERGWHLDPQILQRRELWREDQLLSTLHEREVSRLVSEATLGEAKTFYESHPEKFQTWEQVVVNEILVMDEGQARELRKQLDDGADAAELARVHTLREGLTHHDGRVTLNKGTKYRYGASLFEAARKTEPGGIGGPVMHSDGYSVFKVIEYAPAKTKPFNDKSQSRAKAYVRLERMRRAFVEYVGNLWEKHEVEVFVDYL